MPDDPVDELRSTHLIGGGAGSAPSRRTRADAVVDALALSIEEGLLAPGEPLPVADLAARLGVAAASVRAAFAVLEGMHLIEQRPNRASVVATPTPSWFIAVAAECSGLSIAAADLGVALATDEQIEEFSRRAEAVSEAWTREADQLVGAEALWGLIDLLAEFSRNHYLRAAYASRRTALVFGLRALSRPRNPAMLRSVVDALVSAVRDRDRSEATDIVRDLYIFVVDGVVEL